MATRARELLDRSRALLDRSRAAAAKLFGDPRPPESGADGEILAAVCANVAGRDLELVDALLSRLDAMEAREDDPDRLAGLYHLDHLATRLRRNAENLRVLAGHDVGTAPSEASSLVDVIRAAMSSIDHYPRVTIGEVADFGVVGSAADDLGRLLAELLDNATKSASPSASVEVGAEQTEDGGVLVRIDDEGGGLPPEKLRELNERLAHAPVLDASAARQLGFAVVRRLATRHGLTVKLTGRVPRGTTASVLLPGTLVRALPAPEPPPEPAPQPEPAPEPAAVSGLPRRIARNVKPPNENPPLFGEDREAGHEKLLADLGAFADGERAARQETQGGEPE